MGCENFSRCHDFLYSIFPPSPFPLPLPPCPDRQKSVSPSKKGEIILFYFIFFFKIKRLEKNKTRLWYIFPSGLCLCIGEGGGERGWVWLPERSRRQDSLCLSACSFFFSFFFFSPLIPKQRMGGPHIRVCMLYI